MAETHSTPSYGITLVEELALLDRFQAVYPEMLVDGRPTARGYELTVALDERFERPGYEDLIHARFLVVDNDDLVRTQLCALAAVALNYLDPNEERCDAEKCSNLATTFMSVGAPMPAAYCGSCARGMR